MLLWAAAAAATAANQGREGFCKAASLATRCASGGSASATAYA